METNRFDDLTRRLAGTKSRRDLLRLAARGIAAGLVTAVGGRVSGAAAACGAVLDSCQSGADCCSGSCAEIGLCARSEAGGTCVTTDDCLLSECRESICVTCAPYGESCASDADCCAADPQALSCKGGTCRFATCLTEGVGSCGNSLDCCDRLTCAECDLNGENCTACADQCGESAICADLSTPQCTVDGESCSSDVECCGDAMCIAGICNEPQTCIENSQHCKTDANCCRGTCEDSANGSICQCLGYGSPCGTDTDCCSSFACLEGACRLAICAESGGNCKVDAECCGDLVCCSCGDVVCQWDTCRSGPCEAECSADSDCPGDHVCQAGACVAVTNPPDDGGEQAGGETEGGTGTGPVDTLPNTGIERATGDDAIARDLLLLGTGAALSALAVNRMRTQNAD